MFVKHIARGTTDPEYWIFDLNYLFYQIEFVIVSILAAEITQVLDSIAWVCCASGNVSVTKTIMQTWSPDRATCTNYKFSH